MSALNSFIFYLFLLGVTFLIAKQKTWKKTSEYLGLIPKKFVLSRTIVDSLTLFAILFLTLSAEALILSLAGLDDSQKVELVISNLSIFAVIVAATIGPLAEEVFFRGFLQKHAGVVITAIIFAVLHISFGSLTELVGAFTAGIILGYWIKYRSNSLWPAILAHAAYNTLSLFLVLVVK